MTTNSRGQEVLQGAGTFPYTATVDGQDFTCGDENITTGAAGAILVSTDFGGSAADDPDDNGETASGVSTRLHPEVLGCALAMSGEHTNATDGSPFPKMPYLSTKVHVENLDNGKEITIPLMDLGPALSATTRPTEVHAIDLTRAAYAALGGDFNAGRIHVRFRVLDAVQYIKG